MHYRLQLSPEIIIKSRSLRRHMTRCLAGNVRTSLRDLGAGIGVHDRWDALEVRPAGGRDAGLEERLVPRLQRIAGVQAIQAVEEQALGDLDAIARAVVPAWRDGLAGRRFRVSAKRRGRHPFTSEDIERRVGRALLEACPSARVDLEGFDLQVPVEVSDDRLRLIREHWPGLGGFPLGLQGQALALVSGGFDSPVAAFRMMRRGVKTHFLFFRLGGPAQEPGVRESTHHLWQAYGRSHRVDFISVPFEGVVAEIQRRVPDGLMGVVLKRMMVRAAGRIARRRRWPALVTGDAIAQVSSQTLDNLAAIDQAAELPVLRPLLTEDKQAIIDEARRIGTARWAESMPEYCGVVSRRPHTHPGAKRVAEAEAAVDPAVLEAAIEAAQTTRSDRLLERPPAAEEALVEVDARQALATLGRVSVIDIRAPGEREAAPLGPTGMPCLTIPFFELQERAAELPDERYYLLYCDQRVMSRLQALHLHDRGLTHFGVYRDKA